MTDKTKKAFIITYHFNMSPQKKFRIQAFSSIDAMKMADKMPYQYLKNRLNDLQSYDVESEESYGVDVDKKLRIGFSQTQNNVSDKQKNNDNDVPF